MTSSGDSGCPRSVNPLLEMGTNLLNGMTKQNRNALHYAAAFGRLSRLAGRCCSSSNNQGADSSCACDFPLPCLQFWVRMTTGTRKIAPDCVVPSIAMQLAASQSCDGWSCLGRNHSCLSCGGLCGPTSDQMATVQTLSHVELRCAKALYVQKSILIRKIA